MKCENCKQDKGHLVEHEDKDICETCRDAYKEALTEDYNIMTHCQRFRKETDSYEETTKARKILETQGQIAHIWSWEDVIVRAWEYRKMLITRDQAEEVLSSVERRLDCELGITWITIDCWIDDI